MGSWHYTEYPDDLQVAGSYLFEPGGSIHQFQVPEDNTEVTDTFMVVMDLTSTLTLMATI